MPKYRVTGVRLSDNKRLDATIEASDEASVRRKAERAGIDMSTFSCAVVAGSTPQPAARDDKPAARTRPPQSRPNSNGDQLDPQGVVELAAAQKLTLWAVLANLVTTALGAVVYWPLFYLSLPLLAYAVYRLVKAASRRPDRATVTAILAVVAMLIPFISLIVLLIINQKATKRLNAHGVRVGFMGAKTADLPQGG